jgi:glutamate-5-semialdehyde dehydrogenase
MDKGLTLFRVTCPIGVIGAVFESRPDALVQIACLCIKSGNAVLLKGGSEAAHSNRVLVDVIAKAAEGVSPDFRNAVQLLPGREAVERLLSLDDCVDLLIPRGSNEFVKFIKAHTSIPVLGHADGICHVYVDRKANIGHAVEICFDAKCQYPAVCNAMETLLVHRDAAERFLPRMAARFAEAGVELRGCPKTRAILPESKKAIGKDWKTEYLDLILSIKIVDTVEEAVRHINTYGSHHTDAIISRDRKALSYFMQYVDSASVMSNCSTRFADGFRYGMGAEVGISTNRIHARGPVGMDGLVTYNYRLMGTGQIVADYTGSHARTFTHKTLSAKWKA